MIMYPILALKDAGITDITISLSYHKPEDMMELLGDGSEFGVKLTYVIHGEAQGISYAINDARHVLGREPFVCLLGDNIFTEGLKAQIESFSRLYVRYPKMNKVLLRHVGLGSAKAYGVARFEPMKFDDRLWKEVMKKEKPKLVSLEEKPENPPSPYIMLGAYMLTSHFFDIYPSLTPSERGEFEITDAINALMPDVTYEIYDDPWFDVGTFESIMKASNYLREHKHG